MCPNLVRILTFGCLYECLTLDMSQVNPFSVVRMWLESHVSHSHVSQSSKAKVLSIPLSVLGGLGTITEGPRV